jgi:hypothetical protein
LAFQGGIPVRFSSIAGAALTVLVLFSARSGIVPVRETPEGQDNSLLLIQTQVQTDRHLEEYQTRGIILDLQDAAKWADASYWEQKLGKVFAALIDPRLSADAEERDAVLSTVWHIRPRSINTETRVVVLIPKRAALQSKPIAYAITFIGKTSSRPKDMIEVRFVAEGQAAIATAAPALTGDLQPQWPPQYRFSGFPDNEVGRYWVKNPEERDRVANWINSYSPGRFDQVLSIEVRRGPAAQSTLFHVEGKKDAAGGFTDLVVQYLGAGPALTFNPPQDYASRDFADLQIEHLQQEPDLRKHDRLGALNGLAALPASERLSVKFAIWQYFKVGARNAEVHAILPIPRTGKRILYILRFLPNNDINVERIGEEGAEVRLMPLGDLNRLHGFGGTITDAPGLKAWLQKRYPAIVTAGTTIEAIKNSFAAEIEAKSVIPTWFKENYGIEVLRAEDAKSQLRTAFQFNPQQLAKLKDFTPFELQSLELALGGMSDKVLAALKGLQVARQETAIIPLGRGPIEPAGLTLSRGGDHLILIFDKANASTGALFLGGRGLDQKPRVMTTTTMTFTHEIGHVISEQPGVRTAFEKLVRSKEIKPVTWYAASNPQAEFFPEAFALYHCDPEWLSGSRPDLFAWFRLLSTEELPPAN